jgi:glycosyltransferase involved in cell wall biosynthesis
MLPLSVVIITKNEAANIARCLESVPFAAEKIVLDSGSQDTTVAVAKSHGAKVYCEEWRGFYRQRIRATELASHRWILSLDADEAISPELAEEIKFILSSPEQACAYALPRISFHLGRWIHHGGWYPDWQVRLFDRQKAKWQDGEVHERVVAENVKKLNNPIRHWVFQDISDQVETNNRYSTLGARQLAKSGQRFSWIRLLVKPLGKFVETYIWKRGFLDGAPGFFIAISAAYSMFLKQAKLWEMRQSSQSSFQSKTPLV